MPYIPALKDGVFWHRLIKKSDVEFIITKKNSIKAAAKTFKDPKDPSIVYTVKRTGTSQGRGVYEISTKIGILGDAYGKDELEGLKNYLSSRGMSDNLLKKMS